jgi:hypothetical protein
LHGVNNTKELLGGVGEGILLIRAGESRGNCPKRYRDQANEIANLLDSIADGEMFILSSLSRGGQLRR